MESIFINYYNYALREKVLTENPHSFTLNMTTGGEYLVTWLYLAPDSINVEVLERLINRCIRSSYYIFWIGNKRGLEVIICMRELSGATIKVVGFRIGSNCIQDKLFISKKPLADREDLILNGPSLETSIVATWYQR